MCCAGQYSQGWRMSIRAEENSGGAGKMFLQQKNTRTWLLSPYPSPSCSQFQPESVKKTSKVLSLKLSFSLKERVHNRELFRSFTDLFSF